MTHSPRKRFGQHWLQSEKALAQIVNAAALQPTDRVLEIGPGTGILTRRLLPLAQSVLSVEIDRDLCKLLVKQFGQTENFLLLQGDILSLNLPELLTNAPAFQNPNKVVANIPYNITGPILELLLGTIAHPNPEPYESVVLLMQKEVAERITASPGSKAFGALSVRVQYLADCIWIADVPAKAFQPPPKVDSAVVRLTPRSIASPVTDPRKLDTLVKLGFATKRKMLRNNLKSVIDRDKLTELLESMQLNAQVRAEDLSVANWVTLSNSLRDDLGDVKVNDEAIEEETRDSSSD
ncbi:16S rRNA (adenine(1518)-N(6)/adenine(1519)-N(6))-dimethyltransferase RsmA [Leptolyngbya sp. FACHB-711]|uniref:16S rRNA (adenine(1518)-N(6)/adenine(1519)-N(6))- dimethyltransferase RsmA n=1 Tax=unclassified Leptolyngbya TaxID=2650499 RepID=UPI001687BF05|nr:16S rRNA (adenine(1518)-N(6)/adenine(1519)-N(6))-dimethyltransferase RsmA [Leptolyngbya sp. FACHB-711]MBD1852492.1 16S rRNA (adenine(1518)-N(6)/adenine(1519)-N(6))-dimethyltransferase RsmA [Cyanobacteria bacterium FACHB-502]MBD2024173.1 16S rRNA (adenine(1518)-N(6)/adenine(1519)-N(6))-dimethyltransferase RsmA [Leptolyngbya sp. FACHB-711]